MLPWRNSWFQIAFFAWLVSGALLMVDYAPKVAVTSEWVKAFHREPRPPSEAPVKPSSPSEQPAPGKVPALPIEDKSVPKGPTPARSTPIQSPEKLATKALNVPATVAGSSELAQGQAAFDQKDYAQAMQWYQKSAAQGNADAQNNIGHLYQDGLGVQKDYSEAMKWYQKAMAQGNAKKGAAQGNGDAEYFIGLNYDVNLHDYSEAMKWYQKAAVQGNAKAEESIGLIYEFGRGVPGDSAEAVKWFQKSAAHGNAEAEFDIGMLYSVRGDDADGMKWLQKAAAHGSDRANAVLKGHRTPQ